VDLHPKRVRIVYLSGSGQMGGAERCLLDVMQSVHRHEPSWPLALVASRVGPLVDAARVLGIETLVVPIPDRLAGLGDAGVRGHVARIAGVAVQALRNFPAAVVYRGQLRRTLAAWAPDIVHTNGYKMHIMGTWSRPRSSALVWHLHDYVSTRPLMAQAIKILSRRCDAGIAVSASVGADAAPLWRGRTPVRVVLNGVDVETFAPEGPRADLDALAGMAPPPTGTVRVGLVATLGRFKGHDVFLRAIARLPRDLPIRAYVVSGSLYETRDSEFSLPTLRRMATDLGVGERVGFTGFVPAAADAMRALDVVVHATTVPEPFGLVIAEGMACGRAVITSGAGGAGEVVRPGTDALIHRPEDVDELARAIERLVRDGALRARMGAAGREAALKRFNRTRLGDEIASIYRTVLAARLPKHEVV
jgi:glycosyltransferase involved in cell wall biosynthesis